MARLPQAIKESRFRKNMSQAEFSDRIFTSHPNGCRYENDTRSIPEHVRPTISRAMDDPQVYSAAAEEATNGVSTPYLDGVRMRKEIPSVTGKSLHEIHEAIDALMNPYTYEMPEYWTDEARKEMRRMLNELQDAEFWIENTINRVCIEGNFSKREVMQDWREEAQRKGWIA